MLENISNRIDKAIKIIKRDHKISEKNIDNSIREIKLALLDADVNFKVVKDFINNVKTKALGEDVLRSVSPDQQFIKIIHDELKHILGEENEALKIEKEKRNIIMMVGLQGSGKTTTSAKLALKLKKDYKPILIGADTYRPAAQDQLQILAKTIEVDYYGGEKGQSPIQIAKEAIKEADSKNKDLVIIDTAGRLEIDENMMDELKKIKDDVNPDEILFVSDSMAGQNIVEVVNKFNEKLGLTGIILSKFDSDTRGGAAFSIKSTTGLSIKYIGVGEKLNEIDAFHPERIAGRILGMGDVVSLVEKVQEQVDIEEAEKLEKKLRKADFDLNDFLSQLKTMKKIGSIESIMKMLPFGKNLQINAEGDNKLKQTEAMILSMTQKERRNYRIINGSRKRRIAKGSGTTTRDINNLLRAFDQMYRMMKKMKHNPNAMKKMMKKMGGNPNDMGNLPNLPF